MDVRNYTSTDYMSSVHLKTSNISKKVADNRHLEGRERVTGPVVVDRVPESSLSEGRGRVNGHAVAGDVDIDLREIYFLVMQFLSTGPCQKTFAQLSNELMEHQLLPRRYHAWYSRSGIQSGEENDDGVSVPLTFEKLLHRYSHIAKDHFVRLLKQLMLCSPSPSLGMGHGPNAADVPTLLGTGSFSLLNFDRNSVDKQVKLLPRYLCWPHMQVDQVHGLHLRAIGGGFTRHHRAPSIHAASYAIAKPSTMVQKMQNIKRLRGHRNAVYCGNFLIMFEFVLTACIYVDMIGNACACKVVMSHDNSEEDNDSHDSVSIFDRAGRHVITGSDDRLVKIWSMETAFCLASCRGHEGDITDLAVSSNNALVASASNDFVIRVWRLPDGLPISILQGHTGAVTAIAFSPRTAYQLLSSSDDGTCRIWDARNSQFKPRIYVPKPADAGTGTAQQSHQITCCAFNANGTVFVTGSSDTFARVWNAPKFSPDDSYQPYNEIDLLRGHENDVNYVQFSGCAITARSVTSDALKEEQSLKFKNLWFSHDNIVTCSRDGSAIIWVPRSRSSQGKVGRWTKAYHLKVPPPPLPPQPPRGGPRRRILPTPRGVNMIVWSLDNRFVLAAIMDCRICVWNAADGSLVHCLTGHTESTYVLDVHPFNPRIAMSAGYDGKTIIWDIWEGTPVRVFEIGRGKLVDGKFSSDGTSIVLSDDIGQIYLLNTGQGESHKDAKYDQFFLGDYRPLIRDALGNVLDQESQFSPYQRNLLDPLCDSSMIPYPEPYQSMYQRRRLGALGVEWRPSNIRFAIGPDFSLGEDYQMMPLPDPEAIIDIPEPLDVALWEPENEVMTDDADSEYDAAEEYSSAKEQESLGTSSYDDTDYDAENNDVKQRHKDALRRSKRKNERAEAEFTASGRRIKRKSVEASNRSSSENRRGKKLKNVRKASKKPSSKAQLFRPQRAAARNAMSVFSRIPETSSLGEDEEDGSEGDSSDSQSISQDSEIGVYEPAWDLQNTSGQGGEKIPFHESAAVIDPIELSEAQTSVGNKKKLVLKLSVRDTKNSWSRSDNQRMLESSSSLSQAADHKQRSFGDEDVDLHPLAATDQKPSQSVNRVTIKCKGLLEKTSSAGSDIPVEASCSRWLESGSNGNGDGYSVENAVEFSNGNSHDLEETVQPVPRPPTRIKIKSSGILKQEKNPRLKLVTGIKKLGGTDDSSASYIASYAGGVEENNYNTGYYENYSGVDFPDAETDVVRRTRSMEIKASTREAGRGCRTLKLRKSDRSAESSKISDKSLRSARSRHDTFFEDGQGPPSTSLSNAAVGKISWLMLSEHEPGYRYIPQLGDEVVYLRQGHQEYIEKYAPHERGPWNTMKGRINDAETCLVEGLHYAYVPGSGESCCKLTLKFVDDSSSVFGKPLKLTLPELLHAPDFLVEKAWYDLAVSRNWTPGDTCSVWWRHEDGEGGSWWEGQIVDAKPKSVDFPDSPWERYAVQYLGDPGIELHSPWELHNPEFRWEPPHIDFDTRNKFLDYLSKLERRRQDYGMVNLEQVSHRPDFLNRFPAPLSLNVVRSRLTNNYYRSEKAVKHDINVMMSNAMSYFAKNAGVFKKMKRMNDFFERTLSNL
uniref:Bromo domain-containing protein n=1 Tax=Chenopodium quinoa TaxID=63459 RepID=A0A803M7J1_CHEQI